MRRTLSLATRTLRMWPTVVLLGFAACGGGGGPVGPSSPGPNAAAEPTPSWGVVDPALVGTWMGPIEGSNGQVQASGTMTMTLNADGSMSVVVPASPFHPIDSGTWFVSASGFEAIGKDALGNVVSFVAPNPTAQLDGRWDSGSATGTFLVTKQ